MKVLLLGLLLIQEPVADPEVAAWIRKLSDELIETRDEAARRLMEKGPGIVPQLRRAMESAKDPETRRRLERITFTIEKSAELAKVFGPTYRLTTDSKPRPMKDLLDTLAKEGRVKLETDGIDPNRLIELGLKGATWWEALDRIAAAGGITYSFSRSRKNGVTLKVREGKRVAIPTVYLDQFRITCAETVRLKFEAPGRARELAHAAILVEYQPNLTPADDKVGYEIASAVDAKGADALEEDNFLYQAAISPQALGYPQRVRLRADAAWPVTVTGSASIDFLTEIREISLDLPDGKAKLEDLTLAVEKYEQTETEIRLTLAAYATGDKPRSNGLVGQETILEGDDGKKSTKWAPGMSFGNTSTHWNFRFPLDVATPRKLTFKWQAGYHRVTIPIRLEGIRPP